MNDVSTTAIACALGVSKQTVINRAERENWAYRVRGGGKAWDFYRLPRDVQIILSRDGLSTKAADSDAATAALFKAVGERSREKAVLRSALICAFRSASLRVEDFVSAYNSGAIQPALLLRLGEVSIPTFYRWLKSFKETGVDGVVPRWGLASRSGIGLSDIEKGYLEYWYLTPEQRSAAQCWGLLRNAIPDSSSSYAAALRYLNSLPRPLVDYHRLGRTKFDSLYQPYIDRDPTLLASMDQVVSDHHCFDFVVIRDGKLFRPWITAFQDFRSGKIVGWCPSVSPSSVSIAVALYRMVTEFGAPGLIHIDNGKDYRSKVLNGKTGKIKVINGKTGLEEEALVNIQGAFGIIGAEVTFSRPYHGQSKGRMERTFGTLAQYFSKNTGTYVGSNTVTRPEDAALFYRALNKKAKRLDVLPWEAFVSGLESFMRWWNANWRGKGKGLDGMSADEAFFAAAGPKREVDPEALLLALTKAEVRTVKENGVSVGGVDYWAQELFEFSGRKVIVRLPIANPDKVLVQDPKGRVLCTAYAAWFVDDGDIRANNEKVGAARKANLEAVARYGSGKIEPPEGSRNFIEIAARAYPAIEAPRALAKAAGAEHDAEIQSGPRYINPFDL